MSVGWELWSAGVRLLSLTPDLSGDDYWFETLSDGWSLGSPEAVTAVFASLAADGDDERVLRHGNRDVPFAVKVCGADLASVAAGERALRLALNMAPELELRYTPPDGLGEVTVFDVLYGSMPNQADDLALVRSSPWAEYTVKLRCAPFVRPVAPVTVSLTYGDDTGTSLDAGTSTTGWSASAGSVSAVTYLTETAIKANTSGAWLTRSGLALTASKPFLAVDVVAAATAGVFDTVSVFLSGVSLGAPVAVTPLSNGYRRFFFAHAAAGTTKDVRVRAVVAGRGTTAQFNLYVGGIYAYFSPPPSALMVVDVEGSQRAPVTLTASADSSLGATFLYSDPTMMEYGWVPDDQATWPNAPAGAYIVVVPSPGGDDHFSTLTINGQASSTVGGVGGARFYDYQLGARRDGKIGTITKSWTDLVRDSGTATTMPSTMYLFRDEPGVALLYLSSVTGRYLFVDSPTLGESRTVSVWSGNSSDGSDAVSMQSYAEVCDAALIAPPRFVLWVKPTAVGAAATMSYFPRSDTFVPAKGVVS